VCIHVCLYTSSDDKSLQRCNMYVYTIYVYTCMVIEV